MSGPRLITLALTGLLLAAAPAIAADPDSCATVRMSDPGWTDITSTNGILGTLLAPLGYTQKVETLAPPVTFESLKNGQIDVFLGNWMPAQKTFIEPLTAAKAIDVIRPNLDGIRFTLAVPTYVAAAGVKDFADLAKHADQFDHKIYGIGPGAPANQNIQKMIDAKDFGLDGWSLVESSEQGMLSQVDRATRNKNWIVFLAWEPNPMNTKYPLTYLSGGDAYFGPNYGSATVYTVTRRDLSQNCPNLARLLSQLAFTVDMENQIMGTLGDASDGKAAAAQYLKAHPDLLAGWLAGVTTRDGQDGLTAVRAALTQG
jgi:glycine betaine/proline transport system substrate-binding protein